jgi:hypothetical protein
MKKILFFLTVMLLPVLSHANVYNMNISDAVKNKFVKVSGVNFKGAFTGQSVRLTVNNLKTDSLNLTVDLGLILKPDDSAYQPMVLAGEESIALGPKKKGDVEVYIFCGNSPLHCPKQGLHYTYWKLAEPHLVAVLRYINNHRLFDYLGQNAVWAITNHNRVENIYDAERDSISQKLIDTFCLITGRAKPEYYAVNAKNEVPGQAAYVPKTLKILTNFNVNLRTATILSVGVFDEQNQMIVKLIERKRFERGSHNLEVFFDAEEFGAGKFTIRLTDPEKVLAEKHVESGL